MDAIASPDERKTSNDEMYYNRWFVKMVGNRANVVMHRKEDEDRFFSDVDGTRTQFTAKQLDEIRANYDIPISTKISYAIIEQILAFLSGSKPYPRLIAPSEAPESKKFTELYEQAHNAVWYESKGNDRLAASFRDMLVTGSGYMHTRRNNFFGESTFNVINEWVPWVDVLVDPASREPDFSDAEMMCIAKVMPITKAEKEYDINLTDEDYISAMTGLFSVGGQSSINDPYLFPTSVTTGGYGEFRNDRYCWTRLFYEKKEVGIYISENGDLATERPKPTMVPNPEKIALEEQINAMAAQLQQAAEGFEESAEASAQAQQDVQTSQDPSQALGTQEQVEQANQAHEQETQAMLQQFQQMQAVYQQLPDNIPAYIMTTLGKDKDNKSVVKTVFKVERIKRKQIIRVLMVGRHILEKEILPCQEFPLVHFCLSHNRSPNKTYGISHYIKDIEKAMNKFWAAMVYDVSLNSHQKLIAPTNSIQNIPQWESKWARPGAILEYEPQPELKDSGIPQIVPATPLDQARVQLITMLINLAEYITGIFGVIQGNGSNAPDTFGGMSSLQNFGTQRVKLYGRHVESSLAQLALSTIEYLQAYAPKNQILTYFDGNDSPQEIKILEGGSDLKFKVRVNIANNMPTARHLAAQLIATIGGQTSNPQVADLLTQYALKVMDVPEADEILAAMDVIKNLQSQLQQTQASLEEQTNRNKALENQNYQQHLSSNINAAKKDVDHAADLQVAVNEEENEQEGDMLEKDMYN